MPASLAVIRVLLVGIPELMRAALREDAAPDIVFSECPEHDVVVTTCRSGGRTSNRAVSISPDGHRLELTDMIEPKELLALIRKVVDSGDTVCLTH